jgi:hypothetical protein
MIDYGHIPPNDVYQRSHVKMEKVLSNSILFNTLKYSDRKGNFNAPWRRYASRRCVFSIHDFILGLGMFIVPIVLIIYVIIDYQKRLKRIKVDQLMDELRKQR